MISANDPVEHVEIQPATLEQLPILENLLELYCHDFSDFYPVEIGNDGRFGYAALPLYWSEPDRHPLLIRVDGKLAGFILVRKEPGPSTRAVWDIAEFFVLRAYRRQRVGIQAAHAAFRRLPGLWSIRVMQANSAALLFWTHAVSSFTRRPAPFIHVEQDGRLWHLFSFHTGDASETPHASNLTR